MFTISDFHFKIAFNDFSQTTTVLKFWIILMSVGEYVGCGIVSNLEVNEIVFSSEPPPIDIKNKSNIDKTTVEQRYPFVSVFSVCFML